MTTAVTRTGKSTGLYHDIGTSTHGCAVLNIATAQSRRMLSSSRKQPQMDHPRTVTDHTADRLNTLNTRLRECLLDAENVRARFTKAHDANVWPNLASAGRVPSDDDPKAN